MQRKERKARGEILAIKTMSALYDDDADYQTRHRYDNDGERRRLSSADHCVRLYATRNWRTIKSAACALFQVRRRAACLDCDGEAPAAEKSALQASLRLSHASTVLMSAILGKKMLPMQQQKG